MQCLDSHSDHCNNKGENIFLCPTPEMSVWLERKNDVLCKLHIKISSAKNNLSWILFEYHELCCSSGHRQITCEVLCKKTQLTFHCTGLEEKQILCCAANLRCFQSYCKVSYCQQKSNTVFIS